MGDVTPLSEDHVCAECGELALPSEVEETGNCHACDLRLATDYSEATAALVAQKNWEGARVCAAALLDHLTALAKRTAVSE